MKLEVDYYDTTKIVDLSTQTCSCRVWDLTGIPCKDAVAAIQQTNRAPESYVFGWFKTDMFKKTYKFLMSPIPSEMDWEITNHPTVMPPYYKKPTGRLKKQRKKQIDEPKSTTKVQKKGGFITCSKCLTVGHNARTCKKEVHKNSRFMEKKTKILYTIWFFYFLFF